MEFEPTDRLETGTGMASATGLRVAVLGPLQVSRDGVAVTVPPGKTALLLTVLALSPGQPVSVDELASWIWGEQLPERVRGALQTLVLRVRGALGATAITTTEGGYRLEIEPGHVDLTRFRQLVTAAGRADGPGQARGLLDEALGLWRGELLAGLQPVTAERDLRPALVEERLAAHQRRIDLDLGDGRYHAVITELRDLTGRYPLREPLWYQLITALAGAGRPAEAIQAYHQARTILVEELAVDPSVELQELYQRLLHADRRTPGAAARQVPRPPVAGGRRLAGRSGEVEALDSWLVAPPIPGAPRIATLVGPGGIGKTALAQHWLQRHRDRFGDGVLQLNLLGYGPHPPMTTGAALTSLLRMLRTPPAEIPADVDERAELYRGLVGQRARILLLDNVRDTAQLRALLPGLECLLLATSRNQLRGLVAYDGAYRIVLGRIGAADARSLLEEALARPLSAAEAQYLGVLVELCAGLPLALRVVAERLARGAGDMAAIIRELSTQERRLDALGTGDDDLSDMRAVLSWSYQALDAATATMLRLVAVHPGTDIDLAAAAVLIDQPASRARVRLDQLVAAHLMNEHRPGRYQLHDLVRAYAAEPSRAQADDTTALRRLLDWYVRSAANARHRLYPREAALTIELPDSAVAPLGFADVRAALDWFDSAYPTLLAAAGDAIVRGLDQHAWMLAWAMWAFLDSRSLWQESLAVHLKGLDAARRSGSRVGEAYMYLGLTDACAELHRYDEALAHAQGLLGMAQELGNPLAEAAAYAKLAQHSDAVGEPDRACGYLTQALAIYTRLGTPAYQGAILTNLGVAYNALGRYDEAIAQVDAARVALASSGSDRGLNELLAVLGVSYAGLGRHREALEYLRQALAINRDREFPAHEAGCLEKMAKSEWELGEAAAAREHLTQAADIFTRLQSPRVGEIRALLARFDGP
jgi:DNA-binding SARP family transcriptional activator/Tfp pilus assembly protein PilF